MKKTLTLILAAILATGYTAHTATTDTAPDTITTTEGRFYHTDILFDNLDEMYCQFRSDDNTEWWVLTESEIGHIPNTTDKYILTYDNGGTSEQDLSSCGCLPEWECECHKYDDTFLKIEKK